MFKAGIIRIAVFLFIIASVPLLCACERVPEQKGAVLTGKMNAGSIRITRLCVDGQEFLYFYNLSSSTGNAVQVFTTSRSRTGSIPKTCVGKEKRQENSGDDFSISLDF